MAAIAAGAGPSANRWSTGSAGRATRPGPGCALGGARRHAGGRPCGGVDRAHDGDKARPTSAGLRLLGASSKGGAADIAVTAAHPRWWRRLVTTAMGGTGAAFRLCLTPPLFEACLPDRRVTGVVV